MGRDPTHQTRVLQALSNLALSTAREGAVTASLGNVGQGLTTLTVKNFFLLSNLNLPSFSLKLLPLVLSLHALFKSPSPSPSQPLQTLAAALRSPRSLLFPRLSSPSSPSLSSQQRGSSPRIIAGASSGPAPTAPALSCAQGSRAGCRSPRVVLQNPLPHPAGHTAGDAAQDIVVLLGCECTLLDHDELLINQHPQVLLLRAALKAFSAQPVFVLLTPEERHLSLISTWTLSYWPRPFECNHPANSLSTESSIHQIHFSPI